MMRFKVGDQASLTKTITDERRYRFCKIDWRCEILFLILDSFAKRQCLKERIAHGISFQVLFLPSLGTKLPGRSPIYLSQNVSFRALSKSVVHFALWQRSSKNVTIKKSFTLQTNIYNQSDDDCRGRYGDNTKKE